MSGLIKLSIHKQYNFGGNDSVDIIRCAWSCGLFFIEDIDTLDLVEVKPAF